MRRGALGILIAAAGVAGYILGARSGEGPGTRAPRDTRIERDADERRGDAVEPPRTGPEDPVAASAEPTPPAAEEGPPAAVPMAEAVVGIDATGLVGAESPFETRLRDDLDRGGPMGFFRGILREHSGRPWGTAASKGAAAIVGDADTFARVFLPRVEGEVVDGTAADWRTLADGTTLAYGEGMFEVRWAPVSGRFPRDLVLKGMGMDRTLLRIHSPPLVSDEIHGLTLVDVTVDCRGGKLLWLKSGLAALRLVRCRVVRTEILLDGAEAGALQATACEIDASDVGSTALLATGRGLARLDDCVLRRTLDPYQNGHVACLLRRCTFLAAHPNLERNLAGRTGLRLDDCRFEVVDNPPPPRSLQAINPAWRD